MTVKMIFEMINQIHVLDWNDDAEDRPEQNYYGRVHLFILFLLLYYFQYKLPGSISFIQNADLLLSNHL
jgi:hypothetical protein